jgi:hypothetical protein
MDGTSVPKAAIYENRKARGTKDKVWAAKNLRTPTPTFDLEISENSNQPHFSSAITSALNASHHLGSLGRREYVGHRLISLAV